MHRPWPATASPRRRGRRECGRRCQPTGLSPGWLLPECCSHSTSGLTPGDAATGRRHAARCRYTAPPRSADDAANWGKAAAALCDAIQGLAASDPPAGYPTGCEWWCWRHSPGRWGSSARAPCLIRPWSGATAFGYRHAPTCLALGEQRVDPRTSLAVHGRWHRHGAPLRWQRDPDQAVALARARPGRRRATAQPATAAAARSWCPSGAPF
mmetsp:Transcript_89049/g.191077  ORF Transcript_89049/g.191077 Transcript_89049/m.191077 type:complete len:211 (+) Transcript_89049:900-1532(+)